MLAENEAMINNATYQDSSSDEEPKTDGESNIPDIFCINPNTHKSEAEEDVYGDKQKA